MRDENPTLSGRQPGDPALLRLAVLFELALAGVGGVIAWGAGIPLGELVWPAAGIWPAVAWGVLATLPLLPMLLALLWCQWRPIAWLRRLVRRFVVRLFGDLPIWHLAVLSLAAGVGEEVLFRGAIQPLAVEFTSPLWGVVIASLLFGAVHAASWTYFWLATGVGAYFGCLALWRGEVLSAMVAHALYDFVALACLARGYFVARRPLLPVRPFRPRQP